MARRKMTKASPTKKKRPKPKRQPELPRSAGDSCDEKKTSVQFAKGNSQLQLSACCKIVRDVFDKGYGKSHPVSQRELKQFMKYLQQEVKAGKLLDYCYIQFDLKEDELEKVRAAVAATLV